MVLRFASQILLNLYFKCLILHWIEYIQRNKDFNGNHNGCVWECQYVFAAVWWMFPLEIMLMISFIFIVNNNEKNAAADSKENGVLFSPIDSEPLPETTVGGNMENLKTSSYWKVSRWQPGCVKTLITGLNIYFANQIRFRSKAVDSGYILYIYKKKLHQKTTNCKLIKLIWCPSRWLPQEVTVEP